MNFFVRISKDLLMIVTSQIENIISSNVTALKGKRKLQNRVMETGLSLEDTQIASVNYHKKCSFSKSLHKYRHKLQKHLKCKPHF